MRIVGKIDRDIYSCVTKDIVTDEVIITDERIQHIMERHPNDYERFCSYIPDILSDPDFLIRDEHPNTAMVLKEFADGDNGERFRLALRLATFYDNPDYKNSVLTFLRVRKQEYDRIIRNKEILYKKE